MNDKECFGMFSIFASSSITCTECENHDDCMIAAYGEICNLEGIESFAKLVSNHERLMKKRGLLKKDVTYVVKRKDETKRSFVLEKTLSQFASNNICDEGFISSDLNEAPEWFSRVVDFIRISEKTTQESIVTALKVIIPSENSAIQKAALALQILVANKIVTVKGKTVKWVGSTI